MASVTKRPNGQWRARYRDSAGNEHARHFARKVDAQAWLDGVTTAVQTGSYVDPPLAPDGRQPGRAVDRREGESQADDPGTLRLSPRHACAATLAEHALTRVEHGDVQAWVAQLVASGQSAGHVRKIHGVLSGILVAGRPRPTPAVKPSPRRRPPPKARTPAPVLDCWPGGAACRATVDGRLAVLVLAYCGLRWSELAALRVGRMDLMRRRVIVAEAMTEVNGGRLVWGTPKSHESRSVPIPRMLIDDLAFISPTRAATTWSSPPRTARRCETATRAGTGSMPRPRPSASLD